MILEKCTMDTESRTVSQPQRKRKQPKSADQKYRRITDVGIEIEEQSFTRLTGKGQ
jgi:hypothetical protein